MILALTFVAAPLAGFVQGVRDLGYIEGHNLVVELRMAEAKRSDFPELFNHLVRLRFRRIIVAVPFTIQPRSSGGGR